LSQRAKIAGTDSFGCRRQNEYFSDFFYSNGKGVEP